MSVARVTNKPALDQHEVRSATGSSPSEVRSCLKRAPDFFPFERLTPATGFSLGRAQFQTGLYRSCICRTGPVPLSPPLCPTIRWDGRHRPKLEQVSTVILLPSVQGPVSAGPRDQLQ